jgi:succinoglycan biosynthesis protein ExoO
LRKFKGVRGSRPQPAISVILPTFNSAPFVSRAIDSVLSQEGEHKVELIIADDCSSDDTVAFIRTRYGSDPRLKLIVCDRNGGPGAARNRAIAASTGKWIGLIDADDAWAPNRISALWPLCARSVDLVFDNIIGYDQAAGVSTGPLFPSLPSRMSVPAMAAHASPGSKFNYGYLKPLIRHNLLARSNIKYRELKVSEDLFFYLELLINGAKAATTNEGFYLYTTTIGQRSKRRSSATTTVPDSELMAGELDRIIAEYRTRLPTDELEALTFRARRIRELAPINRLYHNWMKGDYPAVARQCLTDARTLRLLMQRVASRLREAAA